MPFPCAQNSPDADTQTCQAAPTPDTGTPRTQGVGAAGKALMAPEQQPAQTQHLLVKRAS